MKNCYDTDRKYLEDSPAKRFLSWLLLGDPISAIADAIERLEEKRALQTKNVVDAVAAAEYDEESVEEILSADEEAVTAFAEVETWTDADAAMDEKEDEDAEEVVCAATADPEMDETAENDATLDEEDEEAEPSFLGFYTKGLRFIDVMKEPEAYKALKKREKKGEITLITRYRRTFESRLAMSDGEIQEYYSALKNKLFSYRGVKSRLSKNVETYNKGRVCLAKIAVKSKSLYLYLGMDPTYVASLEGGKYKISDLSDKKKYASVPTLIKIKGPRKQKHALELIDRLCREQLSLEDNKKFKEHDYTLGVHTEEKLIKRGIMRMLVAEVPVQK